jgi:HNH endonuclease
VDDERYEELSQWRWHADWNRTNQAFYVCRNELGEDGKQHRIRMHRYLMNAPKGVQVDHRNRDTLDNQTENLRLATQAQNSWNRKKSKYNKSGFTGVRYILGNRKRPWKAEIKHLGRNINLGHFKTAEEAIQIYRASARLLRGEFASV